MRRIILLLSLFMALIATACGGDGDAIPTAAPTVPPESLGAESEEEASPRVDAATSLPPTWTPQAAPAPAAQATPAPAAGAVSAGEGDIYVVQAGDTLAEIATQFGVDLNVLAEVNGIQNIDHIEVGQELLIPQQ